MSLRIRPLSREEHLAFVETRPEVSFLQCPSWADVKTDWSSESLGWVDTGGAVVGAGLVLYRQIPRLSRYLAYIPEGPIIEWADPDLSRWLDPLVDHIRAKGAFAIKMGPPVPVRRWEAATLKKAIADPGVARLRETSADWSNPHGSAIVERLRTLGWLQPDDAGSGFGDVQPRYVFQLPVSGRNLEDLKTGFNQLWRRNIKKAQRAGVEVTRGDYDDIEIFHRLYLVTAERDGFTPRPLEYFQRMWKALNGEAPGRLRLYLAEHEDEVLAATTMVTVGDHCWYSYGSSASHKREVRPSNAVQWRMIRDAYAMGAEVYDMRGISDTLDEKDPLFGLIQFKLGTSGHALEYLGEWDYPVNKLLHKAFDLYMSRR